MDVMEDVARLLSVTSDNGGCSEKISFNGAKEVAQIIQGTGFLGLAIFLIFLNNAKLATSAKAPLEQRYQVCMTICTALSLFSGFFNILQLTEINKVDLPRSTKYSLDIARPIEWVLTCPLIQLNMVIIGGARLPGYRRFMMPLLCVANLLCGVAAMFSAGILMYVWFVFGAFIFMVMAYYNMKQISENSDGEESFLKGDSDYRKIMVLVILTWFPFPIWFLLSPEGAEWITDNTAIQVGWAVLNIVAKFGFILHLQHVKMKYTKKLEATRDLYGLSPDCNVEEFNANAAKNPKMIADPTPTAKGHVEAHQMYVPVEDDNGEEKVRTLVTETMISLGLSTHTDRFLKLMLDAGVCSTDVLERMTQDRSIDLDLPWSLVDAVLRRWKAEKLELGQDKGGLVEKEDPFKKLLAESKNRRKGFGGQAPLPGSFDMHMDYQQGQMTPPFANVDLGPVNHRMAIFEQHMMTMLAKMESMEGLMHSMNNTVHNSQDSICQRMDFAQVSLLQTVNASQVLLHKIESSQEAVSLSVDGQRSVIDRMASSQEKLLDVVSGSNDEAKRALLDTVTSSSEVLLKKLNLSQEKLMEKSLSTHELLKEVSSSQGVMLKKMDASAEATARRSIELEASIGNKVDVMSRDVLGVCESEISKLNQSVHQDVQTLVQRTDTTTSALERGMAKQEERMADITRQNMMVMDMLTSTQERVCSSADSMERFTRSEYMATASKSDADTMNAALSEVRVREVISLEFARLQTDLQELLSGGSDHGSAGGKGLLGSMAERLEMGARRLEAGAESILNLQQGHGGNVDANGLEEILRSELAALAMALTQQQREVSAEQALQVSKDVADVIKSEVQQSTAQITEKVDQISGTFDEGLSRLGESVEQVLTSASKSKGDKSEKAEKGEKSEKADKESRKKASASADRG
jgi:bacteriorhodopsin